MKLYLLTRINDWDYDYHNSFVVAAENEKNALEGHPYEDKREVNDDWDSWAKKENITVECIGESYSTEEKVIIAS